MKTPHTATPRDHLEAVGKAIFGDAYKSPLARALKVDLRSLQRWVSADSDLTWDHGAIADLREILAGEQTEAVRFEAKLRRVLGDLNTAFKCQPMSEAGGGDETDGWGTYGLWELPFKVAASAGRSVATTRPPCAERGVLPAVSSGGVRGMRMIEE